MSEIQDKILTSLENNFSNFKKDFVAIINDYKRKTKRLDKIIKQSDKQQLQVLRLNEELDEYKNHLEKKVQEKTKELQELNASLEERVKQEVEANRIKDKQINEQAKFVQIGELMSNIAHHWRQPLSAISTAASSMQAMRALDIASKEDEDKYIQQIIDSTQFLSNIIRDFADYIEQNKNQEKSQFILQDAINKSLNIIISSLENNKIKVIKKFPQSDLFITSISGKLLNVILNLLKNAQDALMKVEDDREKTITITIQDSGKYVLVSIKDNANGIPEDILSKIFNPYFTTKHQSQGTGLGLYTTKNDVEQQLNGKIKINNSTNGAEFIVVLPKE